MGRPTKEEARSWLGLLYRMRSESYSLTPDELARLVLWLEGVRSYLPTAQTVQRDRERRKRPDPETCPGCGCSPSECACPQGQAE